MRLLKTLKHAFEMVVHSKLRSWLTILGIVVGVAAVIAIVSIGESAKEALNSQLNSLGGDILTITPGFSRGGDFFGQRGGGGGGASSASATTKEVVLNRLDVQALKAIAQVGYIDTQIRGSVKVSYLGKTGSVQATGVDQRVWSHITTTTIKDGRFLDSADQNVVVIGGRLASSFFSKPVGINSMITIEGNSFRVVGILDDQSNSVYMPILIAYSIIPDKTYGEFDTIVVKVKDQDLINDTMTKMESALMIERHVASNKKDFSITSSLQFQQTRAAALSTMTTFLLAIAAVSLIVGAVGVANTMFTSVIEKTKEIGIMKAIGARNKDIMLIFLLNAALIGLVGGVIGIILGAALSGLIPSLLGGIPFVRGGSLIGGLVSLNAIIMAISVSVGIGIVAGAIPAYQASRMKPVDALRYE